MPFEASFSSIHKFIEDDDRGTARETDERWVAIDEYTYSNLHPTSRPSRAPLEAALQHQTASGLPDVSTPPVVGKFFALQVQLLHAKHVLEFGLLGGYSALWILLECPGIEKLTTFEYNQHFADTARQSFERAGVDPSRYEIIVGPAIEAIPKIYRDIQEGKRPPFEFSFIDADKENNWNYFDWAVKCSFNGRRSAVVVDNVVAKGYLASPDGIGGRKGTDRMVKSGREVVEKVGRDDRVDATVLQIVGEKDYDGFLFAVVK